MLLIRNENDSKTAFSAELQDQFVTDCKIYIEGLQKNGTLIGAQPLVREGKILSGTPGQWKEGPYNESKEVMVGYYHILANDMDDAIAIAKNNPEFAYTKTARIEVRPIKMKEESIAYTYPKG